MPERTEVHTAEGWVTRTVDPDNFEIHYLETDLCESCKEKPVTGTYFAGDGPRGDPIYWGQCDDCRQETQIENRALDREAEMGRID